MDDYDATGPGPGRPSGPSLGYTGAASFESNESNIVRLRGGAYDEGITWTEGSACARLLASIGRDDISDVDDSLFQMGLVEVQATSLCAEVQAMLGCQPPDNFLVSYPSIRALSQYVVRSQRTTRRKPTAIILCTGEGAHCKQTDLPTLLLSPLWTDVETALQCIGVADELLGFLSDSLGEHSAPNSPVVSTCINLLNFGLWRSIGYAPSMAVGHSIGEVAAACVAGMISVSEAMQTAWMLGRVGARIYGGMLHTRVPVSRLATWSHSDLCIAALNSGAPAQGEAGEVAEFVCDITLSGPHHAVDSWLQGDDRARRLLPEHPWHHPAYQQHYGGLRDLPWGGSAGEAIHSVETCQLVSTITARRCDAVDEAHWRAWLVCPGERRDEHQRLTRARHACTHPHVHALALKCTHVLLCLRRFCLCSQLSWRIACGGSLARLRGRTADAMLHD